MLGYYDKMAKADNKLSDLQQRFVDCLLEDPDISPKEAYLKAGYAESGLDSQPYVILRNPKVMRALDAEMAKRATRTRITKDRVLREIASMAFSSVDDYVVDDEGNVTLKDDADYRAMKAIQSVEKAISYDKKGNKRVKIKFKLWDKTKSVDMLSRHLNLYKEDNESRAVKIPEHTAEREALARALIGVSQNEGEEE